MNTPRQPVALPPRSNTCGVLTTGLYVTHTGLLVLDSLVFDAVTGIRTSRPLLYTCMVKCSYLLHGMVLFIDGVSIFQEIFLIINFQLNSEFFDKFEYKHASGVFREPISVSYNYHSVDYNLIIFALMNSHCFTFHARVGTFGPFSPRKNVTCKQPVDEAVT